jgi:hypothetical protein
MLLEKFYSQCKDPLKSEPLSDDVLSRYADKVPPEIMELWQYGGVGSYMNGFFWVVNPDHFEAIVDEIYIPFKQPCIVVARDAFGDLFVWEKDRVKFINIRHAYTEVIGRDLQIFFNNIAVGWDHFSGRLKAKSFSEAAQKLGPLEYDECYGYVPILAAGGGETIESLKRVKLKEHLSMIAQFGRKIE